MEKLTVSLSFRNLVLNEQKNIIERSRNSPQSLFGPEEIKAGLLHVHLNPPQNNSVNNGEMTASKRECVETEKQHIVMLTTNSSISVCSLKALGPD